MQQEETPELERIEQALSAITECFDLLFERAPVMMHSINRESRLIKVNRRWLATLGYEEGEVIGSKCVDFLADESRVVAIQDALPLLWQAGSARSIGFRIVRKNGRILNILMDADVVPGTNGVLSTLTTLRTPGSLNQWRQGTTILQRFRKLTGVQRQLEDLLLPEGRGAQDTGRSNEHQSSSLAQDHTSTKELLGTLAELANGISYEIGQSPVNTAHVQDILNLRLRASLVDQAPSVDGHTLTKRELEVLKILALGSGNKEIADHLTLTVRTVRFHIENIYRKLGVQSRTQAVRVGRENGMLDR